MMTLFVQNILVHRGNDVAFLIVLEIFITIAVNNEKL